MVYRIDPLDHEKSCKFCLTYDFQFLLTLSSNIPNHQPLPIEFECCR
jgi:hypothetical protein